MKMGGIKILHVLDTLSVDSGVARMVINYILHAQSSGLSMDIAVHKTAKLSLEKEIISCGSAVYHLPDITLSQISQYRTEFRHLLQQNHYHVVHGHIPNAAFLYLTEAKRENVPLRIQHSHNSEGADLHWKRIRNRLLASRIPIWANCFVACSEKAATYLFPKTNLTDIHIIPNAIDTQTFFFNADVRQRIRKRLAIEDNILCIGHVGRFMRQKNHKFVLEAFSVLHKINPNSKLLLVGNGPLQDTIRAHVKSLGIANSVLLLDQQESLVEYYQAFDVFWLPSYYEGFPIVGIEAQSMGLPCLFSNSITPMAQILPSCTFLPIGNPLLWAETSIDCSNNYLRQDTSFLIAEAGFDARSHAKKVADLYRNQLIAN